ncbi:MAG TPA: amidohydrolase family protein [Myxococcota bacterium]|jgi:predicted TIM-barrel fold metal-dependent hydrolase|nr:amidohydrolase family protein [Myxococcota bacterium]
MSHAIDFQAFDADNHYYEAEDAFTRHIDPRMARRAMQWAEVNGRKTLLVGGKVNRFIPNPTFDPVAKPGCLDEYFRGRNPDGKSIREIFGELEPINPAYRKRDARLALMDTQGLGACFLFPTLGVGMEESLTHDPEALVAAFRAFNRWMDEDWGFAHKERLFAAPYITLVDVDAAVAELEWALSRDARCVVMRAAPVVTPSASLSPADARFDPFWARVNEAGITVAYHSGDSGYLKFAESWGVGGDFKSFDFNPMRLCLSPQPVADLLAALFCGGLLDRHKNLRIATIETGSSWVPGLLKRFAKAYGQMPFAFGQDPVDAFRRHVWVSPYYEDPLEDLRDEIGADHMLFGSDFPHGEGLAEPIEFVKDLDGFTQKDIRLVMRENGLGLIRPREATRA